ncbi:MAG: response regulator [Silicimonas sp.]|nr:response regulator [Silicimonas sp.]
MRRGLSGLAHRPLLAGIASFLLAVFLSATAVWFLSTDARNEIDQLAIANADSSQWSLAQAEVEYQSLQSAVLAVEAGHSGDLGTVRNRFDVFYSRMETVNGSASFQTVRDIPEVSQSIERIEAFLARYVSVIDGPDAVLQASLPRMARALADLRGDLRTISLGGVRVFAERGEQQRESVGGALIDLGLIAFALLATLLATSTALLLITRSVREKSLEVSAAQARLEAIVSTSIDGIVVASGSGEVIRFNGAAERMFGYSQNEAMHLKLCKLLILDRAKEAAGVKLFGPDGAASNSIVGHGLVQLEAQRKNGDIFPIELSMNEADSDEGRIYVSYVRDISGRVEARRELVEARDRAVTGEKAKADLLAIMSHEMRTPLNGVLGTLELLAGTPLDKRQQHFVDVMESSGQMLLEHVNNVLDISRVDAGKATARAREFDLYVLCGDVVGSLKAAADARGNTLNFNNSGRPAGWVIGDPIRLRQVLVNLLGNAIKFTQDGRITLEVMPGDDGENVEFRVTDTGVGMPESDLDRIFDDFVTLDVSYQREVEGTGLGLGIVRRLVNVMGGTIDVESVEGDGTVFWFELPLPAAAEASADGQPRRTPAALQDGIRIMVVEDNEINRMVVREMLERHGAEVLEARDGGEGIKIASEVSFDLILMDISMPRVDGVLATHRIRETEGPNRTTPIIALTAHAMPDDIERFRAAGMNDVLTKPLSAERIEAMLFQQTGQLRTADTAGNGKAAASRACDLTARAGKELAEGYETLAELAEAGGPSAPIAELAHKLAGTAAVVGLGDAHAALVALVEAAAETPADIRAELGRVEATIGQLSA